MYAINKNKLPTQMLFPDTLEMLVTDNGAPNIAVFGLMSLIFDYLLIKSLPVAKLRCYQTIILHNRNAI